MPLSYQLATALITRSLITIIPSALIIFGSSGMACADDGSVSAFRKQIEPILSSHCYSCHNADQQEADLRLDILDPDLIRGPHAETWHDVLNKLNLGEMPPEDEPQLSKQAHNQVTSWISNQLERAIATKRSTGGRVVLRRLTRYEYANTMRDLLGIDLDYAKNLPPESTSPDGFKNSGSVLRMSPLQMEYYLKAARQALAKVIVTGDRPQLVEYHTEESEKGKRKKQAVSNQLTAKSFFLARLEDFPREGEIRVVVRARAILPDDQPFPRMRVTIGVRSDTVSPEKTLGEVDVDATSDEFAAYEFRGRIEDFPLPGHNPKFPGVLLKVRNVSAQAVQAKNATKDKKGKSSSDKSDSSEPVIEIQSLDFAGPIYAQWPPLCHTAVLFETETPADEREYAKEVIRRFMRRAYRRPAREAEVEVMLAFFDKVRPRTDSFEHAIRETLAMVLISPDFLYLIEPRGNTTKRQDLSDYELASRLSYFLWSTMPDDELFDLAAAGSLHDKEVLQRQVQRMLDDSRSRRFVEHFTDQWLGLSGIDRIAINPEYYRNFDDRLKEDMRQETQAFFAWILRHDLSALNLLDADFAMLNHALAKHYGIPGPRSSSIEHVKLPADSKRGGLLTQGSVLLSNSTGEDSHPIKRAVWLLERLLDSPPPPPPPDVPDLSEEPDIAGLSLKRQLEIHRKKEACNNCHRGIDPWGIPFENFDAIGQWRNEVKRVVKRRAQRAPVVASATLPGGTEVSGISELKQHLLQNEQQRFAKALASKIFAYALGRSIELTDKGTIERLAGEFAQNDFQLSTLITSIVQSEEFRTK